MASSVSQQLGEFVDLSARVRTEIRSLELVSMRGGAAGERYPLLLDVQDKLSEVTPKLEALAREAGIPIPSSSGEGMTAVFQAQSGEGGEGAGNSGSALEQLEKEVSSNLAYLRSIPGLVVSEEAQQAEPEGEEDVELSEEAKAIAASFERMLGHKPHPSELAYGMIPDEKTRQVWRGIPMARPHAAEAVEDEDEDDDGGLN